MSERFFLETPLRGETCVLAGDEARHLAAVMRAAVGDEVVVFDGGGSEYLASIASLRKQQVELTIVERREVSRELHKELTLAVALPKGERQKWLVEKATELGVTRLVPLVTERGVAQPVDAALARLRRTVIEASKQCGRNHLLEIEVPQAAISYFAAADPESTRWIGDASGGDFVAAQAGSSSVIAAIGPEGGFAPAEVASARDAGWQVVSLGKRILRVETAALAFAALAGLGDR